MDRIIYQGDTGSVIAFRLLKKNSLPVAPASPNLIYICI